MMTQEATRWLMVLLVAALGAGWDVRLGRIPNWLTLPTCVLGWVWLTWAGGLAGLGTSLGGMVVMALPFVLLWLMGMSGAGDAKLMAAVGALLGLAPALVALAAVALAGGGLAVSWAALHGRLRLTLMRLLLRVTEPRLLTGADCAPDAEMAGAGVSRGAMPYGVAIFAGTFATGVWQWLVG